MKKNLSVKATATGGSRQPEGLHELRTCLTGGSGTPKKEEPPCHSTKKLRARGIGSFDPQTNRFGFVPYNEAPPAKTNVKTCKGGGKRWTTTGADPSRMITLKSKENSADQYADFVAQFNALTKDLKPKKCVEMPERLRVVNEDGLQCWIDGQELTFTGKIMLAQHPRDWQAETLRLVQLVVRRLPACEKFNQLINVLKKGETKA